VKLLATFGTNVVATTVRATIHQVRPLEPDQSQSERIVFFDTSSLPTVPLSSSSPLPTTRIHTILSTHSQGVKMASCAQMDRKSIFLIYWAMGELDAGGVRDAISGERVDPPDEALDGFGVCVKVWDFGVV